MKKGTLVAKFRLAFLFVFTATVVIAFGFAGSPEREDLTVDHPKVRKAIEVQEATTEDLMAVDDVLGTAVAEDADGEMSIVVYVNLEGKNPVKAFRAIPAEIRGVRARPEITEPFRAMLGKPGSSSTGTPHTARQAPPIQLGTSGGWVSDLANGYCCGGTLGSLVQVGGVQYILSNYHVLESDILGGGNGIVATPGSYVIQPGLIDVSCNAGYTQNVATLSGNKSLPGSNVDAAIAPVISGMVRSDGSILEIGTISTTTTLARIGQAVKKSGRTTGLSRSKVSGLNATVSVAYENECAGGQAFTKTFTKQIIISNSGSKFLAAGDSGSLMVEDSANRPKAVGLLFAGSSTLAVANPIDEVLAYFGATMVGQ